MKGRRGTVGIPAWAKAANKRRAQVILLDKEKTPAQLNAEIRLADDKSTKFDFFTTSRVGVHKPNASNVMENGFETCSFLKLIKFQLQCHLLMDKIL